MGRPLEDKKETIIEKCDRFKEEATKYYKTFEEAKSEQERFYASEHFANGDPTARPKNHIFQIVESEIPLLMDPRPETAVLAHDEQNFGDHALVLKAAKDHVYQQQNVFLKDVKMLRAGLKTGTGWQYVDFDPDGEQGEGSITITEKSRRFVMVDPSTDDLDQARYAIIESPISNEDLKRRFPKTAEEAINQPVKDLFLFSGKKGLRENQDVFAGKNKKVDRYDSDDMTFVEDYWLRDYSMEEIPDDETQIQLTEESAQLMQGINPDISKWEDHQAHLQGHRDQIRIIAAEMLNQQAMAQAQQEQAQGMMPNPMQLTPEMVTDEMIEQLGNDPQAGIIIQIIEDHIDMHEMYVESMDEDEVGKRPKYPNNLRLVIKTGKIVHFDGAPDVEDGLIPLVCFECYKDEGPAEGIIKNIIPMQKTINELDAKELRGLKKHAASLWIVDKQSGVDGDTLTDEDDLVVFKEQGTEAQRSAPGQTSVQLEQRSRREYEAMNRIEGTGETVFGEAPKGDPSGVMLRRLQQQALGRIRLKSHMYASAVYRRDILITSRIMKKWSTERKLRSEDANGRIKFLKFDPRMMKDFTYELSFPETSGAEHDPEVIQQTYQNMLDKGQIDVKTFATISNLPKKQELLRILGENDQMAAQMQDMQSQNQELQKQMLMMKANLAPQALAPEEIKMVEQIQLQEQQAQLTQTPQMAVE